MNDLELLESMRRDIPFSHIADHDDHICIEKIGDGVCDFCSMPVPSGAKTFKANDITVKTIGLPFVSVGDWTACKPCAMLIQNNDPEALLVRSIERHMIPWKIQLRDENGIAQGCRSLAKIHAAFWSARI
jgi:hypothetical protein